MELKPAEVLMREEAALSIAETKGIGLLIANL